MLTGARAAGPQRGGAPRYLGGRVQLEGRLLGHAAQVRPDLLLVALVVRVVQVVVVPWQREGVSSAGPGASGDAPQSVAGTCAQTHPSDPAPRPLCALQSPDCSYPGCKRVLTPGLRTWVGVGGTVGEAGGRGQSSLGSQATRLRWPEWIPLQGRSLHRPGAVSLATQGHLCSPSPSCHLWPLPGREQAPVPA